MVANHIQHPTKGIRALAASPGGEMWSTDMSGRYILRMFLSVPRCISLHTYMYSTRPRVQVQLNIRAASIGRNRLLPGRSVPRGGIFRNAAGIGFRVHVVSGLSSRHGAF